MKKNSNYFQKQLEEHLDALEGIHTHLYEEALSIVNTLTNYEVETDEEASLEEEIACLERLLSKTGETPHHHLSALVDLADEDRVLLWPFTNLKAHCKEELERLFRLSCRVHILLRE